MNNLTMNSNRGKEMLTYLPDYYATSRVMSSTMDAQGNEMDMLWQAMDGVLEQYFVPTATWGLELWEQEFGIPVNLTKQIEQRRSVVLSRIRGIGTVTVKLIKSVAEAYDGGSVDIIDRPDAYSFTVKFIDTRGIPPNLDDLKAVIEEIKPAHLTVEFAFTYTQWDELRQTTWNNLKNFTWGEVMTRSWS